MRNADNEEVQVKDKIKPYSHGSNISFMKYFDKKIPNSTEELKQVYKGFIEK